MLLGCGRACSGRPAGGWVAWRGPCRRENEDHGGRCSSCELRARRRGPSSSTTRSVLVMTRMGCLPSKSDLLAARKQWSSASGLAASRCSQRDRAAGLHFRPWLQRRLRSGVRRCALPSLTSLAESSCLACQTASAALYGVASMMLGLCGRASFSSVISPSFSMRLRTNSLTTRGHFRHG